MTAMNDCHDKWLFAKAFLPSRYKSVCDEAIGIGTRPLTQSYREPFPKKDKLVQPAAQQ